MITLSGFTVINKREKTKTERKREADIESTGGPRNLLTFNLQISLFILTKWDSTTDFSVLTEIFNICGTYVPRIRRENFTSVCKERRLWSISPTFYARLWRQYSLAKKVQT